MNRELMAKAICKYLEGNHRSNVFGYRSPDIAAASGYLAAQVIREAWGTGQPVALITVDGSTSALAHETLKHLENARVIPCGPKWRDAAPRTSHYAEAWGMAKGLSGVDPDEIPERWIMGGVKIVLVDDFCCAGSTVHFAVEVMGHVDLFITIADSGNVFEPRKTENFGGVSRHVVLRDLVEPIVAEIERKQKEELQCQV